MGKRIITAADVEQAAQSGKTSLLVSDTQCIITPSALDKALELGVSLDGCQADAGTPAAAQCEAGIPNDACPTNAAPKEEFNEVVMQVCRIMRAQLPEELETAQLEDVVRQVVSARFSNFSTAQPQADTNCKEAGGVCLIKSKEVLEKTTANAGGAGSMVIADAIGPHSDAATEAKLTGGYMVWEKASFPRTLEENEIAIVIEGELHLTVGGNTIIGKAGDMVYLPVGSNVLYSTPTNVKLACINNIQ